MTADELRIRIKDFLEMRFPDAYVDLQGKRLVFEDEENDVKILVLVTQAKRL